jgi:hypothetical protein
MATARAERAKAPEENGTHSGRLLLRMPPALHSELAQAAEQHGMSLNAYITRVLMGTIDGDAPSRPAGNRLLRYAVIADLVLVAVAAVVAVALLIAAWP